jgi:hypothetical protein
MIILAEIRVNSLLAWFSFLSFFSGLGAFYIFVGGLALGTEWYEIVIAIVMCCAGLFYVFAACACAEYAYKPDPESDAAKSAVAASGGAASSSSSSSSSGGGAGASSPKPKQELEDGDARRARLLDNPFGPSDGYGVPAAKKSAYGTTSRHDDDDPFAHH